MAHSTRCRLNLAVVANRLPVERTPDGWEISPGGLVTALMPVLQARGGVWIGWPGEPEVDVAPFDVDDLRLVPVRLTLDELHDYYEGFSNTTLWPLYHDRIRPPEFHRHWWRPYQRVNQRFAQVVADALGDATDVWIHDYHLSLLPENLRRLRPDLRIGFFLHIPFPSMALFAQLPWRDEILRGMLGADTIGFQTADGARHFQAAARRMLGARVRAPYIELDGHTTHADAVPISIDTKDFETLATSPEVARRTQEIVELLGGRRILLGVDRLDYTKGIRARLRAFETLLDRRPELVEEVVFVQVAVPSRENVAGYREMREQVEQMTGRINGRYAQMGRVPVHYFYSNLEREELVAHYRAADVMVITPPRDGMNLVAKEFVACRTDDDGVLVLSEFAGAVHELDSAVVVNPWHVDAMADAYELALAMPETEQRRRMRRMREQIERHDVHAWASTALETLAGANPEALPPTSSP